MYNRGRSSQFDPSQYTNTGLSEDEIIEIKEAFDLFDANKNGSIDKEELTSALQTLGISAKNSTIKNMMKEMDKDKNNSIDFGEFIAMMNKKESNDNSKEELERVFQVLLREDQNKINVNDLKMLINELDLDIKDQEIQEMIKRLDYDGDNHVSFDEFYQFMNKQN